ncbi:MAG: ABC transporter permease [Bacillota bacterium]
MLKFEKEKLGEVNVSKLRKIIHPLSFSFFLLQQEYKNEFLKFSRQYLVLVFIFTIATFFFSLPPAYEFLRTGPSKTAEFDLLVSGPLTETDLSKLIHFKDVEEIAGVFDIAGSEVSDFKEHKITRASSVFLVNNMDVASRLLPGNKKLLMKGSFKPKEAVLSAHVAEKLGAEVGDRIKIICSNRKARNPVNYKISGILYETAIANQVIADISNLSPDIRRSYTEASHQDIDYTSFYLKFTKGGVSGEIEERILNTLGRSRENTMFMWREKSIKEEQEMVKALDTAQFQYERTGAFLLYIGLFLWYALSNLNQRNKTYSILYACGAPIRFIYAHFFLETFTALICILIASMYLTILYFKHSLSFYLPPTLLSKMLLYAFMTNVAIVGIVSVISLRKLKISALASLLTKE